MVKGHCDAVSTQLHSPDLHSTERHVCTLRDTVQARASSTQSYELEQSTGIILHVSSTPQNGPLDQRSVHTWFLKVSSPMHLP